MPKITKRLVDAQASDSGGKRLIVWDSEIRGFGLLVLPSGIKSYFYRYRTQEGRERRITIGKHGAYAPDEARSQADEFKQQVKLGRDPLAAKEKLRNAATVGELLDAYLRSEKFKAKAASTQGTDKGRIERHLRPLLGRRHAHVLTAGDIEKALADIRDGKTATSVKTRARGRARVTGGQGTARMAIELLRAVFAWAIRERMIASNPCAGVHTGVSGTRDLIVNDATDYARLFETIEAMEGEKALRGPVADAIRLIALTGARRGEVSGLRWSHVDLKRGLITLPPSAHKTGHRTGKPRIIGLPAAAQAVIARQKAGKADDYVFAPTKENGPIALSKPWRSVRVRAGLPDGIGLHGLRHSLASHMAMGGAQAAEIMTALGHRQLSTAQRYVHWAQDGRQALAERAASVAMAGLNASARGAGEVVQIGVGRRSVGREDA
jgi:integrase